MDIFGDSEENIPVLEAYGSFVMDMFFTQSDLDVSINFGNKASELPREEKIQILRRFAVKLRSLVGEGQGHVKNVVSIFGARVPIVKFCDQETSIECDLSVENKDGILMSQIIHIISQIDDRFQKLCMLVKYWAKAHEVNTARHGTLNSLSITLLVALHLQTQNPPILPPFSRLFEDGTDPTNVEKRTQKFINWGSRNQESLGRLFATFFIKLHSVEFLWRQGLCVSVLNGLWTFKNWKKASISVEDFTDVSQNVARRVNERGAQKIYSSINRTVEDIFEFLNDKVTGTELRQRLFVQQGVVQPPSVPILNGEFAKTQQEEDAVVEPPLPDFLPLNVYPQQPHDYNNRNEEIYKKPRQKRIKYGGNWKGFDGSFSGEDEEPIPVNLWHEYSQKVYFETWSSKLSINSTVEDIVESLNDKVAGTDLRHRSFGQQGVVQLPPMPALSGEIDETDIKHSLFDQKAVVELPSTPSDRDEEHHNQRVCLENGYRAVGGTSTHGREKIYKKTRGKRKRYGGNWEGFDGSCSTGEEESKPVSLWHEYSQKYDLPPPPPPPYDKVYFETWFSKLSPTLFL